jgi:hypothetical protein
MRIPTAATTRPFPTTKALSAMIAADDDRAVRYVLSELRAANGNVTATAKAVGCSVRTLYDWRDVNARLGKGFEKHALGRPGAGIHATEARLAMRAEEGPKTAAESSAKRKKAK